jgi:hypothetical protein
MIDCSRLLRLTPLSLTLRRLMQKHPMMLPVLLQPRVPAKL